MLLHDYLWLSGYSIAAAAAADVDANVYSSNDIDIFLYRPFPMLGC